MWTRIVSLSAAAAVALYGASALAQSAPCTKADSGSLWTQTAWLRLEVIGGRVQVTSSRCGQHRLATEAAPGSQVRQSLALEVQPGSIDVQYQRLDEQSELVLTVDEREKLTVLRRPVEGASLSEIRYQQPAGGDVTLAVGGKRPGKYSAPSLWHLLVTEAEARDRLLPVLAQLRPNWRLDEQLSTLETALLSRAGEDTLPVRRQWQTWIDQLGSDSFSQRQGADRELRAAGQPVLGYLRQLDDMQLAPEQRRRIAGILTSPAPGLDSPERAADWLVADKRVWLSLMSRGQLDQRIAAAEHLTRLCGRTVAFDPSGSEDQRQAQLAELRAKLAEK
jgi:hypothetical protein